MLNNRPPATTVGTANQIAAETNNATSGSSETIMATLADMGSYAANASNTLGQDVFQGAVFDLSLRMGLGLLGSASGILVWLL